MKRLTGTNKEIAELLYQEQLELSKENRDGRTVRGAAPGGTDCRRGTSQCGKYEAGTDFGGRMLVQRDCIA